VVFDCGADGRDVVDVVFIFDVVADDVVVAAVGVVVSVSAKAVVLSRLFFLKLTFFSLCLHSLKFLMLLF